MCGTITMKLLYTIIHADERGKKKKKNKKKRKPSQLKDCYTTPDF
jgi:hypothetical protein